MSFTRPVPLCALALGLAALATLPKAMSASERMSAQSLRAAPTSIAIDGRQMGATASLWRDQMPTVRPMPEGRPVTGVATIAAADRAPVPAGIRVDAVWLVRGNAAAPLQVEEQDQDDPSYKDASGRYATRPGARVFRVVLRDGPRWPVGTPAEVVLSVADARGGRYLLRAAEPVAIGGVSCSGLGARAAA
jgi:hypothetical protein